MIPNRMIKHAMRMKLCRLCRVFARFSIVLLLSACGGGLAGSGDGGNDTTIIIPLPNDFDAPYPFRHVPETLIARFPSSLSNSSTNEQRSVVSPLNKLTSTVEQLLDAKLELGLLQLHIEANWSKIMEHCATTSVDSSCNLNDAQISTPYTAAMASWEFLLRAGLDIERSGDIELLTDETRDNIAQLVTDKIGTSLTLDVGTFRQNSSGSYRYESVLAMDFGYGETIYTTRWSENKKLTFVSLAKIAQLEDQIITNLQSSTNSTEAANGFSNTILMTSYDNGARQERQLNLNNPLNSEELSIETQLTEILDSEKLDYYSVGSANALGGYLSSEQSFEDESDIRMSDLIRESFNEDATIESTSICRERQSEQQCDDKNIWEVGTSTDPLTSPFFLTAVQLKDLEEHLLPYDLNIQGVSQDLDTLLLVRRENLTISFSAEGIIVTVPGLGTINLTENSSVAQDNINTDNTQILSTYADSLLCRINLARIDNQTEYRSFCAGTTDEIENALVVGETFREGKFVIEWQANASVQIK